MDTRYICTLPEHERKRIELALREAGIKGDDLRRAMESRVCDLADAIEIGGWNA